MNVDVEPAPDEPDEVVYVDEEQGDIRLEGTATEEHAHHGHSEGSATTEEAAG